MDKAPDAFRTISEVADELDIPQHVLRFWETRFTQIKPMKRSGGRRFYRPDDVDLLRGIRRLLYAEGYTIRGVQRILKEQGIKAVQAIDASARVLPPVEEPAPAAKPAPASRKTKAPPIVVVEPEVEEDDAEEAVEEVADATSIVVTPPLPKPFTTPLPSLELRRSIGRGTGTGMVPRSAMPPEVERPPKLQPVQPPPTYLPDLTFDTPMPVPRRVQQAIQQAIVEPVIEQPPKPAPFEVKRLRPILDELLAVRRLLDSAMLNSEP